MQSQILKQKDGFTKTEQLAIIVYILAEINADIFASRLLYVICALFMLTTLSLNTNFRSEWNVYAKWSAAWVAVIAMSFLYTVSESYTSMAILIVFLRSLIMYTFLSRLRSTQMIVQLMYLTIFASLVNSVYMLSIVDFAELGEERLGSGTVDEKWNANAIGMELTFNVFFIYYLYQNKMTNGTLRQLYLLGCTFVFVFVILMTGSRKALFLLVLPILLYYMLAAKKSNALQKLTVAATSLLLVYLIIMTIEPVYNVLGVRVENLIESIGGNAEDGSIASRRALRDMGMRWFIERPILGYGMNTFEPMCGHVTGQYWYSHNNFVEILVGTGIVGFITYYTLYLWMFLKSLKRKYKNYVVGISLLLPILFSESGLVSYKTFIIQFVLMFISAFIFIDKSEIQWKRKTISR
jgi:O-antigen ligase